MIKKKPFHYTIGDYWFYLQLALRNRLRQKSWAQYFEEALNSSHLEIPFAPMVQLIPTESCNLHCLMCNQWGENGYFRQGARPVHHMPQENLVSLINEISPQHSLLSIHGGEPFVYNHIDLLLRLIEEKQMDVIISTNGTLLKNHLEPLADLHNLIILLSVDGDQETHNRIRGVGRFQQLQEGLTALFERRRLLRKPLPLVIMNFVVCEWNSEIVHLARTVAKELGVFALNLNMRWFIPEAAGMAYEKHLKDYFGVSSCGAWRGLVTSAEQHDYAPVCQTLALIQKKKHWKCLRPYVTITPSQVPGKHFSAYFNDYNQVFGCESCFMPFYWARIHANGDLVYCPGNPDIIAGNVFASGLTPAFNSPVTKKFRRYILAHRLPICNRCCGLYVNTAARPYEQKIRAKLGLHQKPNNHFTMPT